MIIAKTSNIFARVEPDKRAGRVVSSHTVGEKRQEK